MSSTPPGTSSPPRRPSSSSLTHCLSPSAKKPIVNGGLRSRALGVSVVVPGAGPSNMFDDFAGGTSWENATRELTSIVCSSSDHLSSPSPSGPLSPVRPPQQQQQHLFHSQRQQQTESGSGLSVHSSRSLLMPSPSSPSSHSSSTSSLSSSPASPSALHRDQGNSNNSSSSLLHVAVGEQQQHATTEARDAPESPDELFPMGIPCGGGGRGRAGPNSSLGVPDGCCSMLPFSPPTRCSNPVAQLAGAARSRDTSTESSPATRAATLRQSPADEFIDVGSSEPFPLEL